MLHEKLKIAILDDYAGVAMSSTDWSILGGQAEIVSFRAPMELGEAIAQLQSFDVLCTMRERMALPDTLFEALPKLKLVTIVGKVLANLDAEAATRCGVVLVHPADERTGTDHNRFVHATPELAWGLMIAVVRNLVNEDRRIRQGIWRSETGMILTGRTLGLIGLGATGQLMARYAHAFGMKVIAWSQHLTEETAGQHGVTRVSKNALFSQADVVSIHLQLSARTRHLVGRPEIDLMKPEAFLINTSRGAIIDEQALVVALRARRIAGAGLDVFEREPLPLDHPLRRLDNVVLTPHIGYSTPEILASFYGDMPEAILAYAKGQPIRVLNPDALAHPKHSN